jgi:hypothetical protein
LAKRLTDLEREHARLVRNHADVPVLSFTRFVTATAR